MREQIKPKEIIEIEKVLGYKIYEEPLSAIYFSTSLTCYATNKAGKVIGFKIRYAVSQYKDISFLKILRDLIALNISFSFFEEINLDFLDAFKNLDYLYAIGNPIKNIPTEIYNRDTNVLKDVRTYLQSLRGELQYLHQAKLLLIGNGEVGKSSIRIKLIDEDGILPEKHERTQGLEIAKYTIKNLSTGISQLNNDIDFDLFIWDFGGQGKYREVQQLFCSRQALYIYVTSVDDKPTKEDYVGFEYWFSMASAFGYDKKEDWQSPIIYVLNKCDIEKKAIDEISVYNTFNNVHEFVKISCYSLDNFEILKKAIESALPKVSKDILHLSLIKNGLMSSMKLKGLKVITISQLIYILKFVH